MKKRIITIVLSALLVLAMLPLTAFAEGAYTVSYDANGADSGSVPASATYNGGDVVTVSANTGLGRTGFTFSGWNTASDGSGTAYAENAEMTMPEGNVVMYAQWSAVTYTVKFDAQGGIAVADWSGNYGGVIESAPVTTYEGYDFFGWYTDTTFASKVSFPYTVTADATFYAKWEPKSAFLSSVAVSGGTLSRAFSKTVYSYKVKLAENENMVTFAPVAENENAKIQMWMNKPHMVASGSCITAIVDNNKTVTVKIKVTYPGAAEDEDLTHVYTFVIKREKSKDSTLSALTVSAGTLSPAFDPKVLNYSLSLDSGVKSVTITPVATSEFAKVRKSIKVQLKAGQTKTVKVTVKSQAGNTLVYTITISRAKSTETAAPTKGGKGGKSSGSGDSDKSDKGGDKSDKGGDKSDKSDKGGKGGGKK